MYHVLETIHQERRRLLFVLVLSYVAGLLAHIHVELFVSGWPIAIFFASLQATVVGLFALAVCLVTPSFRFMVEAFAVSRLIFAVFVFAFPEIGYPVLSNPVLAASIVVLGGWFASRVIHGRFCNPRVGNFKAKLSSMFARRPPRLRALQWQLNFVRWIDDTKPVAVAT